MASMQPTPGFGGNYTQLLNSLQEKETLEDAIEDYVPKCVSTWKASSEQTGDLECYDMAYMDELANYMKLATEQLTKQRASYTKGDKNEISTKQQDRVNWFDTTYYTFIANGTSNISADLYYSLTQMAALTMDGKLSSYATQISNTIDKMTVAESSIGLPSAMERISMGITWPTKGFSQLYTGSTIPGYKTALSQSAFMQKTGWEQYLSTCETPDIFSIKWITDKNAARHWYYEGTESTYKYKWEVTYTVPDGLELTEDAQKGLEDFNTGFVTLMDDKQFVLRHGAAIMYEAKTYLSKNTVKAPAILFLYPITISVKIQGEPNENDTDQYKYQTNFSYTYRKQ